MPTSNASGSGFQMMGPEAFPQSVIIDSSRLEESLQYAVENHAGRVAIAPLNGYRLPTLADLSRFPGITHLIILDAEMVDISAVQKLQGLQYLQISGKAKQSIDLGKLPSLREFRAVWWPKLRFGASLSTLETLSLSRYSPANEGLDDLPEMRSLKDLDLVQSRTLTVRGIRRFGGLDKLTVSYLSSLIDLSPIADLPVDSLRTLEFSHCPDIQDHSLVKAIKSIERLAFNSCGAITSLAFIGKMPNLKSFSFVNTKVLDGDLTPCEGLEFVGFIDSPRYSHKSADLEPSNQSARK